MTLFGRVHMLAFAGATAWLNSGPLGPAELRGCVVLRRELRTALPQAERVLTNV